MQTAPWWGVPVIAGGFLIIGAVLGFLSNFLMEGIRHRREDVRYFRSKLIDAIAEFVDASQEMRRSRIFKHTASQDIKA